MVHQGQAGRGPGAGGAAANHARVHVGGGTGPDVTLRHPFLRPHEMQERQRADIPKGVVGKPLFGLDGLHDGMGRPRQGALFVQSQVEAEFSGIHQRVKSAAVGNAVRHPAQVRHLDMGAVGVDVAGPGRHR